MKSEISAIILRDRQHVEIDIVRQPAVQTQLIPASALASFARRKVKKVELHRLFQLVDVVSRQEHVGNVRLKMLDLLWSTYVRVRVGKPMH